MHPFLHAAFGAALAFCLAAAAHAQAVVTDVNDFAADVRAYNLISLGNVALNGSSDTEGGIAVGGDLAFGGAWTIASAVGTGASDPSLYVNGQMTLSGTEALDNGYASTPNLTGTWTWKSGKRTLTGGGGVLDIVATDSTRDSKSPIKNPIPSGWDWTSEGNSLNSISSDLASAAATGSISVSGSTLDFTTTQTSGVAIFDLDASQLSGNSYGGSSFSDIGINVPTGVDFIINVLNLSDGQTLFGSGVTFDSGTNDDQLLWNLSQTTDVSIDLGGEFYGSILAPNANLTATSSITGQVAAGSFTDTGAELHFAEFSAVSGIVPEPRTFALCAVVLCGLMTLAGWRFRRV